MGHAGAGHWLALILDTRGAAVEAISGSKAEVLAAIRARWPGLPLRQVPHVAENPGGVPRHVEITYVGRGQFAAFILDADGRELVRIRAESPEEIQALLAERYPGLPVRVVPRRNPADGTVGRKEAGQVTDRALRLRANAHPPPGPRVCALCGSALRVEIGHVNGHEEDNAPENKIWTCRACNVVCGNVLRRAGLGRLTRQYNPNAKGATSLGAWLSAVLSMRGESDAMAVPDAVAIIRATPPDERSRFAREIWALRRSHYGPAGRPAAVPF